MITTRSVFCFSFVLIAYMENENERLVDNSRSLYEQQNEDWNPCLMTSFSEIALVYHIYEFRILNNNSKDTLVLSFSAV